VQAVGCAHRLHLPLRTARMQAVQDEKTTFEKPCCNITQGLQRDCRDNIILSYPQGWASHCANAGQPDPPEHLVLV